MLLPTKQRALLGLSTEIALFKDNYRLVHHHSSYTVVIVFSYSPTLLLLLILMSSRPPTMTSSLLRTYSDFIVVALLFVSRFAIARYVNTGNETVIRIGYISDLADPSRRIQAIHGAVEQGKSEGLLPGYEYRLVS